MVRPKEVPIEDWSRIRVRLTQEDLDFLSQMASSKENLRNEIVTILESLVQGHFHRTQKNVDLVKNMLTRLTILFNNRDLEPNQ